jgi:hypothetical protein
MDDGINAIIRLDTQASPMGLAEPSTSGSPVNRSRGRPILGATSVGRTRTERKRQ